MEYLNNLIRKSIKNKTTALLTLYVSKGDEIDFKPALSLRRKKYFSRSETLKKLKINK